MSSTVRKRGKYYHYDSNTNTGRTRISLRTSNKNVAQREKTKLDRLYLPKIKPRSPWEKPRYSAPVDKVVDEYLRWLEITKSSAWASRQAITLRTFEEWTTREYLHMISPADIEDYIAYRMESDGIRASTIKKELGILKRMWDRALRDGFVETNVIKRVEAPRDLSPREIRAFTRGEVMAILKDQRDKPRYPLLATLYYTGLRLSDVMDMQASEFDLKNALYERKISKTGKTMRMPLSRPLVLILRHCLRPGGPAFPRYSPENETRRQTIRRNLLRDLKRILERLDIPEASLHSFRHAFNQRLFELGLRLEDRQSLMGHAAGSTTQIYTHPDEDLARSYLDRL